MVRLAWPESNKVTEPSDTDALVKVVGEGKSIPMHVRASAIDLAARTFTMRKKDGN
jgi:hypothetical protein